MSLEILFVIGSLDVGGAERHLLRVVPALQACGYNVAIYCVGKRGVLAEDFEAAGVPVFVSSFQISIRANKVKRMVRLLATGVSLTRFIHQHRPYLVHCFLPEAYLMGAVASNLVGHPRLVMSRRSLNNYQRARPLLGILERWLHGIVLLALANSYAVLEQLWQEGIRVERTALIYNGVELPHVISDEAKRAMRESKGITTDGTVLIVVANLKPYKGHEELLRALGTLAQKGWKSWTLLVAGRDDGIGKNLRILSQELGIAGNIRWLGAIADTTSWLQSSDLGVLCSHEEGFSNAILEGMACGIPFIVTNAGGNAEAIAGEQFGWVVPPKDVQSLSEALGSAMASSDLGKMGAACRIRAESQFSLDACIKMYRSVYERRMGLKRKESII